MLGRYLTHKEVAINLFSKGVFRYKTENKGDIAFSDWYMGWGQTSIIECMCFCFLSDLDTDREKWHPLTIELLDIVKNRI